MGFESLDGAAEARLAGAMYADATDAGSLGYSDDELKALIAEGDASGAAVPWDAATVRDEVRARFVARRFAQGKLAKGSCTGMPIGAKCRMLRVRIVKP